MTEGKGNQRENKDLAGRSHGIPGRLRQQVYPEEW
jgi:hypothetical protein